MGAQPPQPPPPAGASAGKTPAVVGMRAPDGWDQNYGELGRGPYAAETDTNTRLHPTHTFLPGNTYSPEVSGSAFAVMYLHTHMVPAVLQAMKLTALHACCPQPGYHAHPFH